MAAVQGLARILSTRTNKISKEEAPECIIKCITVCGFNNDTFLFFAPFDLAHFVKIS